MEAHVPHRQVAAAGAGQEPVLRAAGVGQQLLAQAELWTVRQRPGGLRRRGVMRHTLPSWLVDYFGFD